MPQKHPGREGTSEEERKEKEEKGSTTWACVSVLQQILWDSIQCVVFCNSDIFSLYSEEEEEESEEEGEDPTLDSLSQAIAFQVSVQIQKTKYFAHHSLNYIMESLYPSVT